MERRINPEWERLNKLYDKSVNEWRKTLRSYRDNETAKNEILEKSAHDQIIEAYNAVNRVKKYIED